MRARWTTPEDFRDRHLARCGIVAFAVLKAMECMADDGGVTPADADRVKGELLYAFADLDVAAVSGAIEALAREGVVEVYAVGQDHYAQIVRFEQDKVHKPSKFRFPRATQEEYGTSTVLGQPESGRHSATTVKPPTHGGPRSKERPPSENIEHDESAPSSTGRDESVSCDEMLALNADNRTENTGNKAVNGVEYGTSTVLVPERYRSAPLVPTTKTPRHLDTKRKTVTSASADLTHPDFPEFWESYPKRGGSNSRSDAETQFARNASRGVEPRAMIDGAVRYALQCEERGITKTEFVMQARRFLGKSRFWEEPFDLEGPQIIGADGNEAEMMAYITSPEYLRGGR